MGFYFMEIWKDIPNYEGYYQASNLGKIKSLDRVYVQKNRWKNVNIKYKGRLLKPYKEKTGYLSVRLSINNKSKSFLLHKLIAITFLNHTPNGHKIVIDHDDNNKENNNVSNLKLITQRKNASKDRYRRDYTSKYVGVSYARHRSKWVANLIIDSKLKNLGGFEKEHDAHLAYQKALKEIDK